MASQLVPYLDRGDALVVPTFVFPKRKHIQLDIFPTDRDGIVEWIEVGRLGLHDHHWPLNAGPTSYHQWKHATEPYLVTGYDYHYGPVYITRNHDHPW